MRIDCEMHIGEFSGDPYVWLGHPVGPAELEAVMDEYRLDMTMVMAPTAQYPDNERLADALVGHDRLIGFAVVNPYGPDGGEPELRRAVTEWGMKGLKLMPLRHGYEVDGRTAWKVMESASELGVPVSIQVLVPLVGLPDLEDDPGPIHYVRRAAQNRQGSKVVRSVTDSQIRDGLRL